MTPELKEDYVYKGLERRIQLDIWLPQEMLAFEYQGQQHFYDIHVLGPKWYQKQRDEEKRMFCLEKGIILIEIPYWWDFKTSSLIATIHLQRPDLIPEPGDGLPIHHTLPESILLGSKAELMHGEDWDGKEDLTGWWMSEKMDGVRAYWDGNTLFSKLNRKIQCPDWFTEEFPRDTRLDGELWLGRETFEQTMAALNTLTKTATWKDMKYMIFDLPKPNIPYENRMQELKTLKLPAHAILVQSTRCNGNDHLFSVLDEILSCGGEGLMMIKSQSLYIPGRRNEMLKVKSNEEGEVQLMEVIPDKLYCQQLNGIECLVGCYSQVIQNPPSIGSVITVKHCGVYQNGTLRHAYYWRKRSDIKWSDISKSQQTLAPNADWTHQENCRLFFDNLKDHLGFQNMDQLFTLSLDTVRQQGGRALLDRMFDGSLMRLLQFVYPNHKWNPWRFTHIPKLGGYWESMENQREYMNWLASELGFEKLEDWYRLKNHDITENGGSSLLLWYQGSPSELVQAIYPEHKWVIFKFETIPKGYWTKKESHREFMDWLAFEFDFKMMEDWYKITANDIVEKGGSTLLQKYKNSPPDLVMSVFPEHKWLPKKFAVKMKG